MHLTFKKYKYEFVWSFLLLTLFVVTPFFLLNSEFDITVTLAFIIGIASLLSDGFLTLLGLNLKLNETNLTFQFLKNRVKNTHLVLLSRIIGFLLLVTNLIIFRNVLFILIIDYLALVCVMANCITLFYLTNKNISNNDKK